MSAYSRDAAHTFKIRQKIFNKVKCVSCNPSMSHAKYMPYDSLYSNYCSSQTCECE